MSVKKKLIVALALAPIAVSIVGWGAGSADVPAEVPHPRKMSDAPGKSLADVAKDKGMNREERASGGQSKNFNPTNPGP